ncbi:MAG TPA: hypothetical protein VJ277_13420 [Gemmatimonadales bacterium]|nr:hypothetical protein [Gemmatimonadales bacterium]
MKDKSMAADLKKRGITRSSGACPWGCGAHVANGGGALVAHLGQCKGSPKRAAR